MHILHQLAQVTREVTKKEKLNLVQFNEPKINDDTTYSTHAELQKKLLL